MTWVAAWLPSMPLPVLPLGSRYRAPVRWSCRPYSRRRHCRRRHRCHRGLRRAAASKASAAGARPPVMLRCQLLNPHGRHPRVACREGAAICPSFCQRQIRGERRRRRVSFPPLLRDRDAAGLAPIKMFRCLNVLNARSFFIKDRRWGSVVCASTYLHETSAVG